MSGTLPYKNRVIGGRNYLPLFFIHILIIIDSIAYNTLMDDSRELAKLKRELLNQIHQVELDVAYNELGRLINTIESHVVLVNLDERPDRIIWNRLIKKINEGFEAIENIKETLK